MEGLVKLFFAIPEVILFFAAMLCYYGCQGLIRYLTARSIYKRMNRRLVELKAEGFAPTHQYVGSRNQIAIDTNARKIFLANSETANLYSVDDILALSSDYLEGGGILRLTVRNLDNPLFKLIGPADAIGKFYSLITVLRAPPAKIAPDPAVVLES
jgi:hypothetical protein